MSLQNLGPPGARQLGRARFYDELARLLEAGLPLRAALRTLGSGSGDAIARAADRIEERIREGAALAEAVAAEVRSIEPFERHALESAERCGELPATLRRLAAHFQARGEAIGRIAAGLAYPALLVHLCVLLPNLALLLTSGARGYLRAVGPPLFSIWTSVAAALLLCRAVAGTWAASRLGDAALALPALGPLFCAAGFADWIEAFSLLHRSGVPMVEGLERAADSVRNARLRASAHRVAEAVRGGAKLSEAVAAERGPLFPPMFVESARIAEESGKYDETFERAAKFAREEAEKKFRRLVGAILAVAYIGAAAYVGYTVLTFYAGMYRGLLDR